MSATGPAIARAAEALAGIPFRLHGREAASGLDCVGLVALALSRAGLVVEPPQGYRLRARMHDPWLRCAARSGLMAADDGLHPGDILLVRPGPAQLHLCVCAGPDRFVHAHAGLGRVVIHRGALPWPILRHWRARDTKG